MKVTFEVKELQKRLGELSAIVARKSEEEVYKHVRLFTDEAGAVKITGLDIDSALTVTLPKAKADGPVNFVLLYSRLTELVANTDVAEAAIVDSGKGAQYSTKKGKYIVKGFPVDKFTELPVWQALNDKPAIGGHTLGLPGLKSQISLVDFSVPDSDGKFVTSCIQLESDNSELKLVATDGVQLVFSIVPANLGEFTITLPKPALDLIKRLDGGPTITIIETEGALYFVTELETLMYSRTHAAFPAYQRIIPDVTVAPVTKIGITNIKEFAASLGRARAISRNLNGDKEAKNATVLTVVEGGDTLTVQAGVDESGTDGIVFRNMGDDEIVVTIEGAGNSTRLDIDRILPFIELAEKDITILLKDAQSIVDIHADGGNPIKPTYRLLIMPMRS